MLTALGNVLNLFDNLWFGKNILHRPPSRTPDLIPVIYLFNQYTVVQTKPITKQVKTITKQITN